jgi:lipopolysaccharide export system protein LptA
MRRFSVLLALAALVVMALVFTTYRLRVRYARSHPPRQAPKILPTDSSLADQGWEWNKTDPQTGEPIVRLRAKSFRGTRDPSTYELHDLTLRLYNKEGSNYTFIRSGTALFDEKNEQMRSSGPVFIVMRVPKNKDGADPKQITDLVQVDTSGIVYQTKSGVADTNEPARFHFPQGDGKSVGVTYDPASAELHMKSKVALDWIGTGSFEKRMHIESGDLVWKARDQKVYLSPWSKLQRQTTSIQAKASVVTLDNGVLKQIDSDHAVGADTRENKQTRYAADKMTAFFDDDGQLVNIVGQTHARIESDGKTSRTAITSDRADLRFTVQTQTVNGKEASDSILNHVMADGRAVAKSDPILGRNPEPPESHILRSEHIDMVMRPDGKEVAEIQAPQKAQLEFVPNRAQDAHRTLDASRLQILYGDESYIDNFLAWNAVTHTDKPKAQAKSGSTNKTNEPALTWSDRLHAKFLPHSNSVDVIEQIGHFRYQEGVRKANSDRALLEQTINRITLTKQARVVDDTGSTAADVIVMNQANGDMDARGHVASTHAPDKNQKPGTSMLDTTQSMQAKADQMETRDDNSKIFYQGSAVMWQGANRISADAISIDRDEQELRASGNVVSELVDSNGNRDAADAAATPNGGTAPIFTVVYAPELLYRDDTRLAKYTGGVKLVRDRMTVTAKQLNAYLTPKTTDNNDNSSLDRAVADGDVKILRTMATGQTRTGSSQHCEFFAKENKVVLNGGDPQITDSYKGITKGEQLTYFSDDDRLLVNGKKKALAFTQMRTK